MDYVEKMSENLLNDTWENTEALKLALEDANQNASIIHVGCAEPVESEDMLVPHSIVDKSGTQAVPLYNAVEKENEQYNNDSSSVSTESILSVVLENQKQLRQQALQLEHIIKSIESLKTTVNTIVESIQRTPSCQSPGTPHRNENYPVSAHGGAYTGGNTKSFPDLFASQGRNNSYAEAKNAAAAAEVLYQQQKYESECRRREEERKRQELLEQQRREEEARKREEEERRRKELDMKRKNLMSTLIGSEKSSLFGEENAETPKNSLFEE